MSELVPSVIQIGAIRIAAQRCRLDDVTFGDSQSHPTAVIRIDDRLPDDQAASTMIHELLHVISDHWGLDLTERQVCSIEQALAALMVQNPELMPEVQRAFKSSRIDQD